jgi:hypothetical protein
MNLQPSTYFLIFGADVKYVSLSSKFSNWLNLV